MNKPKLVAIAMVAALSMIPALTMAPAASAAPAPRARASAPAPAPGTDPVGTVLNGGLGLALNVGAGAACVVGGLLAALAQQVRVDPGLTQVVRTLCSEFVASDATQAITNAGAIGTGVGMIVNDLLPSIGDAGSGVL